MLWKWARLKLDVLPTLASAPGTKLMVFGSKIWIMKTMTIDTISKIRIYIF